MCPSAVQYNISMRRIDSHVHIFPEKVAQKATQKLTIPGVHHPHYDGTLEGLIASMDRFDIEKSWALPVATSASQVESINNFVESITTDRIVKFGAIHPDVEDAYETLSHFRERGFVGFKMHPDYQMFVPNEARMEPIWRAAEDFELIAYFHAGDDMLPRTKFGTPKIFAECLDTYPKARVALAHFGGFAMWDDVEEYLIGRDVWLDTAYTLSHLDHARFVDMARRHGFDHVMFGTDGPWTDPARDLAWFEEFGLTDQEKEQLFWKTSEDLLALVAPK